MICSENFFEFLEEVETIDDQYTDELWFEDIDQKVFFFKHKLHNCVREVETQDKSKRSFKSNSKSSSKSSSSKSSRKVINKRYGSCWEGESCWTYGRSFIHTKRKEAQLQAETLKVEQELAKSQTRVRVPDSENKLDQRKTLIPLGTEKGKEVLLKEKLQNYIVK